MLGHADLARHLTLLHMIGLFVIEMSDWSQPVSERLTSRLLQEHSGCAVQIAAVFEISLTTCICVTLVMHFNVVHRYSHAAHRLILRSVLTFIGMHHCKERTATSGVRCVMCTSLIKRCCSVLLDCSALSCFCQAECQLADTSDHTERAVRAQMATARREIKCQTSDDVKLSR